MFGMSNKRVYDETDYSVDPKADQALSEEGEALDLDSQTDDEPNTESEQQDVADLLDSLMGDDDEGEGEANKGDL